MSGGILRDSVTVQQKLGHEFTMGFQMAVTLNIGISTYVKIISFVKIIIKRRIYIYTAKRMEGIIPKKL